MLNYIRRGITAGFVATAIIVGTGFYPAIVTFAQDAIGATAPTRDSTVSLEPLINAFMPYLVAAFMTGIFALASLVVAFVKQKWNVDMTAGLKVIEAKYRESLHSAVYTGVANQIAKGAMAGHLKINVGSPELASIMRHLAASVPEAMGALNPSEEVIAKIATAKAVELAAANNAPGSGAVPVSSPALPPAS